MGLWKRLFGPPDISRLLEKNDVRGLVRALSYRKDADLRQRAASALQEIDDPPSVCRGLASVFEGFLNDNPVPEAREAWRYNSELAMEAIRDACASGLMMLAMNELAGSGSLGGKSGGPRKSSFAVKTIADAMAQMGDVRAVEPLSRALDIWNCTLRFTYAGTQWVQLLATTAASSLDSLAVFRQVEDLKAVLDTLADAELATINAFAALGDSTATDALLRALDNQMLGYTDFLAPFGGVPERKGLSSYKGAVSLALAEHSDRACKAIVETLISFGPQATQELSRVLRGCSEAGPSLLARSRARQMLEEIEN